MSGITFSGVATGMDTSTMISQLVSLERVRITQLEEQKSNYNSQISIVQGLNSKLQALQKQAEGLSTVDKFLSYETETSDSDYVTLSASGNASPGSYSITVDSLATAERRYSSGISAKDETGLFGSGTLSITIDDGDDETTDTVDIDVTSEDTLETLVSKINSADVAVNAGIMYDGTNYYLQVSGKITGDTHAISITESGTSLGINDAEADIVQTASNAQIQMDGFAISSDSNEITTAIPGVTLRLHDETPVDEPVNISISPNSEAIVNKIKGFVDAYNSVISLIHDEFKFTGEAKGAGRLTGDSTLRSVQMQLTQLASSAIDDLPGGIEALSQLGIKSDNSGSLVINESELSSLIADNAGGVAQLFAGTADHSVKGLADRMDDLIETFVDYSEGILNAKVNGMKTSISSLDKSIERQEEYVSKYEDKLRAQFTSMELMVSSLQSQSNFLMSI